MHALSFCNCERVREASMHSTCIPHFISHENCLCTVISSCMRFWRLKNGDCIPCLFSRAIFFTLSPVQGIRSVHVHFPRVKSGAHAYLSSAFQKPKPLAWISNEYMYIYISLPSKFKHTTLWPGVNNCRFKSMHVRESTSTCHAHTNQTVMPFDPKPLTQRSTRGWRVASFFFNILALFFFHTRAWAEEKRNTQISHRHDVHAGWHPGKR
jgi:hypothetical protein